MKILYISTAVSHREFFENELCSKKTNEVYGMPIASNKFHNLIMQGIYLNGNNVTSLSCRPISRKTHNKIIWFGKKEVLNNIIYKYIPFINIFVIKHIIVALYTFIYVIYWNSINIGKKKKIIYDAAYVNIIPSLLFGSIFFKTKKIAIFADLYSYMADVENINRKQNFTFRIIKNITKICYNHTDKYVFLSNKMNDLINKKAKPYEIVEGIVENDNETVNITVKKTKKDVIMYAGALKEEYGLKLLIDGFMKYRNDNSELWIFGNGNYIDEILKAAKVDKRIIYGGILRNADVLTKELQATILINPRPTCNEFTKYSFPSKIMEYMTSGTPVLTTKLAGIPEEYYKYLFFINNETVDGIATKINEVIGYGRKKLYEKGLKAKKFVYSKKNNYIQAQKIIGE